MKRTTMAALKDLVVDRLAADDFEEARDLLNLILSEVNGRPAPKSGRRTKKRSAMDYNITADTQLGMLLMWCGANIPEAGMTSRAIFDRKPMPGSYGTLTARLSTLKARGFLAHSGIRGTAYTLTTRGRREAAKLIRTVA